MDDSENLLFEIRGFDPVRAFSQTLCDIMDTVKVFQDPTSGMTGVQFLEATRAASEQLKVISTMALAALVGPAAQQKIPDATVEEFQQRMELEQLMSTPEDDHAKMIRILKHLSMQRPNGPMI